jgi:hypothetical protein
MPEPLSPRSIAPLAAVAAPRRIEAQAQGGTRQPLPGELLRLRVSLGPLGELLASDEAGLRLQLPAGTASPGEWVSMRVLSGLPRLALQRLPESVSAGLAEEALPPPASGQAGEEDWRYAALRPDRAWLQRRQQGLEARQPASVAAQWRSRALAEQLRLGMADARDGLLAPGAASLAQRAAEQGAALQLAGWGGQVLWMRLMAPLPQWGQGLSYSQADPGGEDRGEYRYEDGLPPAADAGLCLSLNLRFGRGWLMLLLQWRQGLLLHFVLDSPEAAQALRQRLPAVSRRLAAVPLRLRHCRLSLVPPLLPEAVAAQRALGLAQSSSAGLFRAAAEIAQLLQETPEGG